MANKSTYGQVCPIMTKFVKYDKVWHTMSGMGKRDLARNMASNGPVIAYYAQVRIIIVRFMSVLSLLIKFSKI